jgi:starch synthase
MEKTKVLYISQEISPYLPDTEMSLKSRFLPQGIQEKGMEIRTFMPRFGCINERRNQLHEVIRLSGMNLIIDDTDHPLIIKVASIQCARMQVYFIDNEDYFQRKNSVVDDQGHFFKDNDERAIFFARGVLETVKKLRWKPDIVHCHGWFSALIPLYLKKAYQDDPLYNDSKVIFSVYDDGFSETFSKTFKKKLIVGGVSEKDLSMLSTYDYLGINKMAISYSDGVIIGSEKIHSNLEDFVKKSGKPYLNYQEDDVYIDEYSDFYDKILNSVFNDSK